MTAIDSVASAPRTVALGGGHGLFATLSAARRFSREVTAVVTVADDGGSSGRLRSELGVLPPGDLRMALAALAAEDSDVADWTATIQHRFGGIGALAGHSVGNLMLAGLTEVLGDPVAALDELARLLRIEGRVLPMSPIALDIEADVQGLEADPRVSRCIRGQVAVATTPGKVRRVRLLPSGPPACPDAVDAIGRADMVVLGPGSWFSSVIPHVLVPEVLEALSTTGARKVLVLNLAPEPGETAGFSAERHLHVLSQHAPDLSVDHVVVDSGSVPAGREREHLDRAARKFGARTMYADVAKNGTHTHHADKLAAVFERLWSDTTSGVPDGAGDERAVNERESASWQ
ncbi:uridine diphosphate-N-acetylglucosamine-binding protein YvcK [Rhodococcus sp. NPDC058521]|uniref:gluconeogenesis factor YvcK family protein n=1 Tax=Rhodococcus sp. NPDC058521 TaxID=3346536 RepID=UPI00365E7743